MIIKKTRLWIFAVVTGITFIFSNSAISQCSGTSLEFDGMDDYLHTPFENYDFSNFTAECWINVPSYNVNVHYVSLQNNAYIVIGDWADSTSITAWASGLTPETIGSTQFDTTDTWYHIAYVYDGINQYIYINGIINQTVPSTGTMYFDSISYNSGLVIGARYNQSQQYVEGKIDEVRLWNVARSQVEIQNNMNSLLAGNEAGLMAYYQFEDGSGSDTVTDITGNGNTLTLYNMDINNDWVNDSPVDLVYNFAESVSICSGDSNTFPDGTSQNNITSQVIHVSNLLTVNSCDSIITTTVNVNPVYELSEEAFVCNGESYRFPDGTSQNNITSQVIHVSNLLTVNSCDSIITTTVNVNPVYELSEEAFVCNGESYRFPDGILQDNITSQVIHVSNLLTVNSCDSIITTTVNVKPEYDLNEEVTICSGEYYIFPDGTLQHNITGQVIHVSNLVTVYYCDSIITTTVNIDTVDTSVSLDDVTLTANVSGAVYQWIDCNNQNAIIEGETSQSFTPDANGDYAVIITENSCTDTSDCYNVIVTEMNVNHFNSQIIVYPNPANNTVNIEVSDQKENILVELTNINNQIIIRKNFNNKKYLSVDISTLTPGIYFIKVYTEKDIIINKFIKE